MKDNLLQELETYINKKVEQLVRSKTVNCIRIEETNNEIKSTLNCEIENRRLEVEWLKEQHIKKRCTFASF